MLSDTILIHPGERLKIFNVCFPANPDPGGFRFTQPVRLSTGFRCKLWNPRVLRLEIRHARATVTVAICTPVLRFRNGEKWGRWERRAGCKPAPAKMGGIRNSPGASPLRGCFSGRTGGEDFCRRQKNFRHAPLLVTASSARTRPNPGIRACKRRSARVPRSAWTEPPWRARHWDWLQAIGAW